MLMQHAEVPIPRPKDDEVLLKVEAVSLNPFDWKIQNGVIRPFYPRNFPHIPCVSLILRSTSKLVILKLI